MGEPTNDARRGKPFAGRSCCERRGCVIPRIDVFIRHKPRGGKWSATKRWARKQCGGKLPCVGERGPYFREFQRRKRYAAPYAPPLVDTVDARERGINKARLEADAAEAREFRDANVIDLLDSDDELRERPPKRPIVV